MRIFDNELKWLKGNLHTHTQQSDGAISVVDAVNLFKDNGYHFIAVTDHKKYTPARVMSGFIMIPGEELDFSAEDGSHVYHITSIGAKGHIDTTVHNTPQKCIDEILRLEGMPVIAHPAWSIMSPEDILKLSGYEAVEVFNGISEAYAARGISSQQVDAMANRNVFPLLLATDDCHFYDIDHLLGWIMVNCESFTESSIMSAIRAGRFYATQGPEIRQITVNEDKSIDVETGDVKQINVLSSSYWVRDRIFRAKQGGYINHAHYVPAQGDRWVRVEAVDEFGKIAWSNYIRIEK